MRGLRRTLWGYRISYQSVWMACCLLFMPSVGHAAEPSLPPSLTWQSSVLTDHPLVGRVWDSSAGRWIPYLTLSYRLSNAHWVLLGEQHDNPDHHMVQASLLGAVLAAGRRPGVAVEMVDPAQQSILDHASSRTADLGKALQWEKRGWPSWAWYQPLFAQALSAGLPLVAANIDRAEIKTIARAPATELPAEIVEKQTTAVVDGHCGLLPADRARPMVQVQVARDQAMARALMAADQRSGDGAVLIAGAGHVRNDIAAPVFLPRQEGKKSSLSIGIVEVRAGEDDPQAYEASLYDYLVFTPQAVRQDPCERLKERFSQHPSQ